MPDDIRKPLTPAALLTGLDAKFVLSREQMRLFALTDDGVLHVSRSHVSHPFVMSFISRLKLLKVDYLLQERSIDDIAKLYAGSFAEDNVSRTSDVIDTERAIQMQNVALEHIRAAVSRRESAVYECHQA